MASDGVIIAPQYVLNCGEGKPQGSIRVSNFVLAGLGRSDKLSLGTGAVVTEHAYDYGVVAGQDRAHLTVVQGSSTFLAAFAIADGMTNRKIALDASRDAADYAARRAIAELHLKMVSGFDPAAIVSTSIETFSKYHQEIVTRFPGGGTTLMAGLLSTEGPNDLHARMAYCGDGKFGAIANHGGTTKVIQGIEPADVIDRTIRTQGITIPEDVRYKELAGAKITNLERYTAAQWKVIREVFEQSYMADRHSMPVETVRQGLEEMRKIEHFLGKSDKKQGSALVKERSFDLSALLHDGYSDIVVYAGTDALEIPVVVETMKAAHIQYKGVPSLIAQAVLDTLKVLGVEGDDAAFFMANIVQLK